MHLKFEWDEDKNRKNRLKHGVDFEEAKSVFDDEYAIQIFDNEHSDYEDRFITVGMSIKYRELFVCYCERAGDVIRIISARKAQNKEKISYHNKKGGF